MIAFELKTQKMAPAKYNKKDISQGHDHLEWLRQNFADYDVQGLMFVGPDGVVSEKANPSREMMLCRTPDLAGLREKLVAVISDLRRQIPIARIPEIMKVSSRPEWTMTSLVVNLRHRRLA